VAAGIEDEGTVGVLANIDGQVAIGTFVLSPLGEVTVDVDFGCFFEEVAEVMCAVGLPLLEQVVGGAAGSTFGLLEEPDQAGRVFAGELGGVHGVVVLVDGWRRVAS
jgi:hypothetical protein